MQNLSVTILTSNEIDTRWPSNGSLTSDLVKIAVEKDLQIGLITLKKPLYHPEIGLRDFCLLALEAFYKLTFHSCFIIDTSELINDNKLYIAFSKSWICPPITVKVIGGQCLFYNLIKSIQHIIICIENVINCLHKYKYEILNEYIYVFFFLLIILLL